MRSNEELEQIRKLARSVTRGTVLKEYLGSRFLEGLGEVQYYTANINDNKNHDPEDEVYVFIDGINAKFDERLWKAVFERNSQYKKGIVCL